MFLWFNSNNECNSNGKVIVIGFLYVSSIVIVIGFPVIVIVIVIGCLNI